ncbi:MAG TPA: M64 family metallopeptidase [Polyangiaceae bacterium]
MRTSTRRRPLGSYGFLVLLAAQSSCSAGADTSSESSTGPEPTTSTDTSGSGDSGIAATTSAVTTSAGPTTASSTGRGDSGTTSPSTSGGVDTSAGGASGSGTNGTGGASTIGSATTTGATATTGAAGGGTLEPEPLDCGPDGWVVENHGPPSNRVNYIILGDGYDATSIDTDLEEHVNVALDRRFNHESGEPYGRYRKFVNICVMKVVSESNGIGNGPTAFDGGNGGDRLAAVNSMKVNAYLDANLPETIEADWRAVVLNQNLWENTGSALMLWSGAHAEAPGAALHEGGHGFHQLADEYCASSTGVSCGPNTEGSGQVGQEHGEINSTGNPEDTLGKWDRWLGVTQVAIRGGEATGVQGTFEGSRYVDSAQYRPSGNSMMNSLFGLAPDTSFNGISREQMIYGIWRHVVPIDATEPAPGTVTGTPVLKLFVIDPEVIDVDWSVDGEVVAAKGGTAFDVANASLASGTHTISATAYDNATEDLVKYRDAECPDSVESWYCHSTGWANSTQTVEWTVSIP